MKECMERRYICVKCNTRFRIYYPGKCPKCDGYLVDIDYWGILQEKRRNQEEIETLIKEANLKEVVYG